MKKLLLIGLFVCLGSLTYAQRCDTYYTSYSCRPSPQEAKDMILSSQSRGAELEANKTYSFRVTFFRNMDYRLIFCAPQKFYPIHYVIKDAEEGNVLFDNKDDDYIESIGFTMENTTIVTIDVTLLAEGAKFKDFRQNRTCFGLPILYRRVEKIGF
jgi:hypothetical protein